MIFPRILDRRASSTLHGRNENAAFWKNPENFGQIWRKFSKILAKFAKFWKKTANNSANFNETFDIREASAALLAPAEGHVGLRGPFWGFSLSIPA